MSEKYDNPTINVISPVKAAGQFPVVFSDQIAGGFQEVDTLTARNNIPSPDPANPGKRREGMLVYVKETNNIYQLVGGVTNNDWEVLDVSGSSNQKEIVFQLGTELMQGVMGHTEMWIPYTGTITKIYCSVGEASDHTSNLIFTLQKYDDTQGWVSLDDFEMKVEERKKSFNTELNLDNNKIRIVLSSGDYSNVANMSIIANFEKQVN